MSSRRLIFILLIVMLGCEGWQGELITSEDYEPMLNVLAVLSPDDGGVVAVRVQRTLPLEGAAWEYGPLDTVWSEDSSEYWIERSRLSLYHVDDALVTLTENGSLTWEMLYDRSRRRYRHDACYVPEDTSFVPREGATYELEVSTPGGLSASGSVVIPPAVRIDTTSIPDTLTAGEITTLSWNATTGYYLLEVDQVWDTTREWSGCYYADQQLVLGDTSRPLQITPECYPGGRFEGGAWTIAVTAVDENYYRYFLADSLGVDWEDIVLFFLGEGSTARSYGIQGGMGVMGSYRVDRIRRWVRP